MTQVQTIADELSKLDPEHADAYQKMPKNILLNWKI